MPHQPFEHAPPFWQDSFGGRHTWRTTAIVCLYMLAGTLVPIVYFGWTYRTASDDIVALCREAKAAPGFRDSDAYLRCDRWIRVDPPVTLP